MSEPSELVANPSTSPEVLGRLAYEHPELQPQIVAHPRVYAELLQWISSFGTPAGRAAAASRLSPPQAGPPPPPASPPPPVTASTPPTGRPPTQASPDAAVPAQTAVATADEAVPSARNLLWGAVATVLAFSLALGAIWFGQHRAAEKTSAELEQAFGELDAAIEATLQAEERVEAALAELDREAGRYGGVSFDALDMEMDAAETMVLAHLVLTDAYRAIRHVEKPGVTDRALIGEARDAVEALEQQIPVLDELAEEIKEVTAELSRE